MDFYLVIFISIFAYIEFSYLNDYDDDRVDMYLTS